MNWFNYKDGDLCAEDVKLSTLAREHGTPLFVYSKRTLERHIESIDGAFSGMNHLTCYSVKANSNGALLSIMAGHGLGADIVSGGELFRALRAGFPADSIVYSGVGKTAPEIRYALESGILMFNVESESELSAIDRIAGEMGRRAPVSFRVNPDVDPKTHPYISTGLKANKFGIPHDQALRVYREAAALPHIDVVGIDAHIGSQLIDVSPFGDAVRRLAGLIGEIRSVGIELSIIDIGGGLGIRYENEDAPDPEQWAQAIGPLVRGSGCRLIVEPGRAMVGNAGVMLTQVQYVKKNGDKTFVVVDAGMNDLARPSLYRSYHAILPVREHPADPQVVDVVGPICESGDFLAKDRSMRLPDEGEFLAVMSAGAYGMTMSSNYNSRPRAAEVLVDGADAMMVRGRETYEDLIAREQRG